ncbi:MAG: hypothetical protein QW836_08365 [Ignisphaera sp.]
MGYLKPGCGVSHSCEPELDEGELWVGVSPKGWRPMIRPPMKGGLRSVKPRVDINQYETQTPITSC